jgi:aminoglycoside 6'-N-acetyltransferase I
MKFSVRQMGQSDAPRWTALRTALLSNHSFLAHEKAILELLQRDDAWGLIAETTSGETAGFCEIEIRPYANGCLTQPVPFLEGIWVDPKFRRQGVGAQLIRHAEALLLARGFREFGSDVLAANQESLAAHAAWGFCETVRVVYFRKPIGPRSET